ncbi:hypothetical protein PRZ48_011372 [Zasmidium cellare]|uniref:Uncharacterized protein n=1 Tax=Zasmidium cellare TaxID=395010 RepID=A0ABR0E656_ZASCE|nr:hypothetical protein PRZ48_011372 [Zasmidium cellare]
MALRFRTPHIEDLPTSQTKQAPGFAWVAVSGADPPKNWGTTNRKRQRSSGVGGQSESQREALSARQQREVERKIKELNGEGLGAKEVVVPKAAGRTGKTGNVKKILGSGKGFGHYLDDEEAEIARTGGRGDEGVNVVHSTQRASKTPIARRKSSQLAREESSAGSPAPSLAKETSTLSMPDAMDIDADEDDTIPSLPTPAEMDALLNAPPLTYNQARSAPPPPGAPPPRRFYLFAKMLTPREHDDAEAKLYRFGERFDLQIQDHLPHDVVMTKQGTVSKRQPRYIQNSLNYYRGQCSFRRLDCSGSIEDLQQRLKSNYNHDNDAQIDKKLKKVSDIVVRHVDDYCRMEQQNQYWRSSTFGERAQRDPMRALKESLEHEDVLRTSYHVFRRFCRGMKGDAEALGLAYECVELDPNNAWLDDTRCQIVGEPSAVKAGAIQVVQDAARERRAAAAKEEARLAKMRAQHEKVLDEAEKMTEWDITGSWIVECEGIFEHYPGKGPNSDLTMEIWRDNFDLGNIRSEERPIDEEGEKGSEHGSGGGISMDEDEDYWDEEEKSIITGEAARIPRYCADFDFHVTEGIMRIYPPKKHLPKNKNDTFSVKDNPSFRYIWRGRDTGDSEIILDSDKRVERLLFGSDGTTFKGTWKCPCIDGVLMIKGRKIRYGNQQEQGAKHCWENLSKNAWEAARVGRWG